MLEQDELESLVEPAVRELLVGEPQATRINTCRRISWRSNWRRVEVPIDLMSQCDSRSSTGRGRSRRTYPMINGGYHRHFEPLCWSRLHGATSVVSGKQGGCICQTTSMSSGQNKGQRSLSVWLAGRRTEIYQSMAERIAWDVSGQWPIAHCLRASCRNYDWEIGFVHRRYIFYR